MIRSKVTDMLSVMAPDSLKVLSLFVRSPIHNKNKNIIKLFDALLPFHPGFSDDSCTKEIIFKKIFDKKQYNDKIMRNLMSEFFRLFEEFLIYQSANEPRYKDMLLFDRLIEFDNVYLKKYNDAWEQNKQSKFDRAYFSRKIYLNRSKIRYYLDRGFQKKIAFDAVRRGEYQIFELLSHLPENISNMQANEKSYNAPYEFKASDEFFRTFDYTGFINSLDKNNPDYELIILNYERFMMFYSEHPEDIEFSRKIKQFIIEHSEKVTTEFLFELLLQLQNFYVKKMEFGYEDYVKHDLFEIQKFQVENQVYSDRNWLRDGNYKEVLKSALGVNEFEWAENFIKEFNKFIHPTQREFLLQYGYILIAFKKKNYSETIDLCNKLEQNDFQSKFFIKWILYHVYFEMDYYDQFFSIADTFRKFIDKTENFTEDRKKYYKLSIKFGVRLMRLKSADNYKTEDLLQIKNDIKSSFVSSLFSMRWLFDKISDMENKLKC